MFLSSYEKFLEIDSAEKNQSPTPAEEMSVSVLEVGSTVFHVTNIPLIAIRFIVNVCVGGG